MSVLRSLAAAAVAAGVLAGCASHPSSAPPSTLANDHPVMGTAWHLEGYRGDHGSMVTAVGEPAAVLSFDSDSHLSGSTGCNGFSGPYARSGSHLSVTLGPMTQIACSGELGTQDSAVPSLLRHVRGLAQTARMLTLTDARGGVLLSYRPGVTSLPGTSWRATAVNNGRGGLESKAGTGTLTASFGRSGAFTGFGGCNHLSGSYATTGARSLRLTGLVSTQMACGGDVDALEAAYVTALGQVTEYQIQGATLTLRDSGGAAQVTYQLVG